jgi:hypothetical protein
MVGSPRDGRNAPSERPIPTDPTALQAQLPFGSALAAHNAAPHRARVRSRANSGHGRVFATWSADSQARRAVAIP